MHPFYIITIDGTSGAGKSTLETSGLSVQEKYAFVTLYELPEPLLGGKKDDQQKFPLSLFELKT